MTCIAPSVKILRIGALAKKIGISRSTIYDWLNPKSPRFDVTFPKQRRLGMHSVGWMESEIDKWLEECCPQV